VLNAAENKVIRNQKESGQKLEKAVKKSTSSSLFLLQ
jgi:hypothetical protein